jgi:hypothetical protein
LADGDAPEVGDAAVEPAVEEKPTTEEAPAALDAQGEALLARREAARGEAIV